MAQDVEIEVWPENWVASQVFARIVTQWRYSFNGPTGLDYNIVEPVVRMLGIKVEDWPDLFTQIQVLEQAALSQIHKNQEASRSKK